MRALGDQENAAPPVADYDMIVPALCPHKKESALTIARRVPFSGSATCAENFVDVDYSVEFGAVQEGLDADGSPMLKRKVGEESKW